MNAAEIWQKIKPHAVRDLGGGGNSSITTATGALTPHALSGPYHTGDLARTQATWVATDIAAQVAAHSLLPDAHHAKIHDVLTDHITTGGAALDVIGQSAANTLARLTPSAAPGAASALLKSDSAGNLTLPTFTADAKFLAAFGAASAPSFSFSGNTGTGIFRPAANSLGFSTNGGERLRIIGTGDVGIGQTAPGYKLDVNGTMRAVGTIYANSDMEVTGEIFAADGTVGAPAISFLNDIDTGIYRSGTNAYTLVAGGAAIANIGPTGIGINAAFDTTAALKVQSAANDDITLFLKQKAGQTARMWRVEDSAGTELIVLDSVGNLQSGNPGFVSGLTGWQITPTGTAEFNNVWVRGELHASIFVMDEFHASGGTLYIAPAGKLENPATVNVTAGVESIFDIRTTSASGSGSQLDIRTTSASGSGSQLTLRTVENYFEISDPPSGHALILSAGDIVRCKALGLSVGIDLWDVWGVISRVEDLTSYYRYYFERKSGGTNALTIPAGTAIISYGKPGDGRIYLTSDQGYAPYMQVFITGAEPWNGDITPTVRVGRLDGVGLPGVSGIPQHGIVMSTDLSNASAPYMVMSNLQQFQFNIDSEWNNGNPTARITAGGAMQLGTDIDNPATTGFAFDPATGALTIGSAAYPGSVTVYGNITVTGGNAAKTDFSNITATLDNVPNGATYARTTVNQVTGAGRAYTALDGSNNLVTSVIPATAVTPGGAGLFLGSNYMGYYNGSAWKTYIDNSGNMKLLGNASNNYLQWSASSNKLQGVGGGTEQWYADATNGKLYAAAGAVWVDAAGINVAVDTIGTPDYIRFDRSGATVGSIGFLRSTGPVPLSTDGMIFNNAESTKFRFLGASQTEFGQNVTVTGWIQTTGDVYVGGDLDAPNVLAIRSTAP